MWYLRVSVLSAVQENLGKRLINIREQFKNILGKQN